MKTYTEDHTLVKAANMESINPPVAIPTSQSAVTCLVLLLIKISFCTLLATSI